MDEVEIEVDDGIAQLVLCRPAKRNAMTADMWSAVIDGVAGLARREDVGALLVRGSGGSFCAGADLASVRDATGAEDPGFRALAEAGLAAVRHFPRPTAALVEGACIGAGCLLATACDVRFATPDATFAVPTARYGLRLVEQGLVEIVALLGPGQAQRFLLAAQPWCAAEAARAGLVEVCGDDAGSAALEFLAGVTRCDRQTVAHTRATVRAAALLGRVQEIAATAGDGAAETSRTAGIAGPSETTS